MKVTTDQTPAQPRLAIRRGVRDDLERILEIERASFPSPWPAEALADELKGTRWSKTVVCTEENHIIGFMIYWTVGPEVHLLNVAVDPPFRGHGAGTAMIEHLVRTAAREKRKEVFLEVRVSNEEAFRIYTKAGFEAIDLCKNYYPDTKEDALLMRLQFFPE